MGRHRRDGCHGHPLLHGGRHPLGHDDRRHSGRADGGHGRDDLLRLAQARRRPRDHQRQACVRGPELPEVPWPQQLLSLAELCVHDRHVVLLLHRSAAPLHEVLHDEELRYDVQGRPPRHARHVVLRKLHRVVRRDGRGQLPRHPGQGKRLHRAAHSPGRPAVHRLRTDGRRHLLGRHVDDQLAAPHLDVRRLARPLPAHPQA